MAMREFLTAVYDYPWTTFFVVIGCIAILNAANNRR
jgi:hypothetical protein